MKRNLLSTLLLSAVFVFLAGFLPHHVFADVSISLPAGEVQKGKPITVNYSGAEAGECYVWRVNDGTKWITTAAGKTCDGSDRNYASLELNSSSGSFTFTPQSTAGDYGIYFFKSGSPDCTGSSGGDGNCDFVKVKVTNSAPISPSPVGGANNNTYNCDNRPPGCSAEKFPQCQDQGSFGACGAAANSDYSCLISNTGGSSFCAFAEGITLPPTNSTLDCTADPRTGTGGVIASCPDGWKQGYQKDPNSNACQCWPDNLPKPSPTEEDANKCPVCSDEYPNYSREDGACHKDADSSSDKEQPVEYQTCLPQACSTGKGCGFQAKNAPPPLCITFDTHGECQQVATAVGDLHIEISEFTKTIFSLLLSISGAIILFIVLRSGYILMISQGNAEKVKEAQDRLTSAAVGLLFLIFSLVVLEVIGVDILHIPGFGS